MKTTIITKSLFLMASIAIVGCMSSCSKDEINQDDIIDDDITEVEQIAKSPVVGRWQLIGVYANFGGIYDYSNKNIEYQFLSGGVLKVSDDGSEDGFCVFLKTGEHQYALDEKTSKITIDGSTYFYRFKDKELIIDTGSAWDAPVYVFKRIKK